MVSSDKNKERDMKYGHGKKKEKEGHGSASTAAEIFEGKSKGYYFISKIMASPSAVDFPVPTFYQQNKKN